MPLNSAGLLTGTVLKARLGSAAPQASSGRAGKRRAGQGRAGLAASGPAAGPRGGCPCLPTSAHSQTLPAARARTVTPSGGSTCSPFTLTAPRVGKKINKYSPGRPRAAGAPGGVSLRRPPGASPVPGRCAPPGARPGPAAPQRGAPGRSNDGDAAGRPQRGPSVNVFIGITLQSRVALQKRLMRGPRTEPRRRRRREGTLVSEQNR